MSANNSFLGKIFEVGKAIWDSTDPNKRETESLNQFISTIKEKGVAKTGNFIVTIGMPKTLLTDRQRYEEGQIKEFERYLAIVCNTAELPGISYDTSRHAMNGEHKEVPYDTAYTPVTVSFYVDSEMKLKFFFDNWIDSMRLHSTKGFAFYKDFISQIDIDIVDPGKDKVYSVKLLEAYPKSIEAIPLSWSSNGLMELRVTFSYKSYVSTSIDAKNLSDKPSLFDTLFGGQGWYEGGKEVISKIGSVVSTVDEYTGRFETLRGKAQSFRDQMKGISGIFKSKKDRVKDLGKWL